MVLKAAAGHELNPSNIRQAPAIPLEQLCQHCLALRPHRAKRDFSGTILTRYERFDEYPSYPSLEETASRGCHMCGFLRTTLLAVQNPRAHRAEPNETHPFWGPNGEDVALKLDWDRKIKLTARFEFYPFDGGRETSDSNDGEAAAEQEGGMVVSMWLMYGQTSGHLRDDRGNEWGSSVLVFSTFDRIDLESPCESRRMRLPSSQTLSTENVQLMRKWMRDCSGKHADCPVPTRPWLPSRLVEILGSGVSSKLRLAPMTDDHIAKGCQYVALSHMWGDMTISPPYRTFQANLEEHLKEIDKSKLPRNFQDAVRVSEALNIRYLWIDSLCIVQDSHEDWMEQAVQMHLVYRHAQVTIVATQASSSHDGFLQRDVQQSRAIKIEYELEGTSKRGSVILARHESSREGQRMHAIDGARWNTRGWTMQERSLSTRTIHFCRNKLFFECRGALLSEENEPPQEAELLSHVMWPRGEGVSDERLYENWELHVIEFCRRNLTNCRDKLPAIRSIAEEMSERTRMEYVACAGMWRPYFKRELLWTVGFGKADKPPVPRAPSWSWASLDAHTYFVEGLLHGTRRTVPDNLDRLFQVYPFEVLELRDPGMKTAAEDDRFGHIRVKTLTRELKVLNERLENPGRSRNFFPIDFCPASSESQDSAQQVVAHGRFDLADENTMRCPLLYAHVGETSRITGLILERVGEKKTEPSAWRRVGVATLFECKTGKIIADDAVEGLHEEDSIVIL